MKKNMKRSAMVLMATVLMAAGQAPQTMTKENGTYIINTTSICKAVEGYNGTTPLKIYIRKNKVEKIEALPNQETPKHWRAATSAMLDKWNGLTVKKALALQVDGRTGATYSSDAIRENVKRGLEYYEKNK